MIDKKPAVGRYILTESIMMFGKFGPGGIITKVSGKRIYFETLKLEDEDNTKEQFVMKFTAVCDTKEEYDMLLAYAKKMRTKYFDLIDEDKLESAKFFE